MHSKMQACKAGSGLKIKKFWRYYRKAVIDFNFFYNQAMLLLIYLF